MRERKQRYGLTRMYVITSKLSLWFQLIRQARPMLGGRDHASDNTLVASRPGSSTSSQPCMYVPRFYPSPNRGVGDLKLRRIIYGKMRRWANSNRPRAKAEGAICTHRSSIQVCVRSKVK